MNRSRRASPVPKLLPAGHGVIRTAGLVLGLVAAAAAARLAFADPGTISGPDRQTTITLSYTRHTWWLSQRSDKRVACQLAVEHEGPPTEGEIYALCGTEVYEQWLDSAPCPDGGDEPCPGLYLTWVTSRSGLRTIEVDLPPPQVWISLTGCEPTASGQGCRQLPRLMLRGQEPLPNHSIVRVRGLAEEAPFVCDESDCSIPIPRRPDEETARVQFWAESSFGDTSQVFEALIRVRAPGLAEMDPEGWQVDILSTQLRGDPNQTCAIAWESFPPGDDLPEWLTTPSDPEELSSDIPYVFLAGMLIARGEVDASACPDGGLMENGGANACGVEKAQSMVEAWQNRFDGLILEAATGTGVPARLMKNLFARESQFWPAIFNSPDEAGLGQLTEGGTDTVLLWNPDFFGEFCPLVFPEATCARGYARMAPGERAMLRGALHNRIDATCEECDLGIDLSKADFSVRLFAETLVANCHQVGQVVRNVTRRTAGEAASYVDLWRFTLANYHAGPGCLGEAITSAWSYLPPLLWEDVEVSFSEACQSGPLYVDAVARP